VGRPPGEGPGPVPASDVQRNITDRDSRVMRSRGAICRAITRRCWSARAGSSLLRI
jgi:hypothetical protein